MALDELVAQIPLDQIDGKQTITTTTRATSTEAQVRESSDDRLSSGILVAIVLLVLLCLLVVAALHFRRNKRNRDLVHRRNSGVNALDDRPSSTVIIGQLEHNPLAIGVPDFPLPYSMSHTSDESGRDALSNPVYSAISSTSYHDSLQSSGDRTIQSNPTYSSVEPDGARAADSNRLATAVNPAYDTAAATATSPRTGNELYDHASLMVPPTSASALTGRELYAITEELQMPAGCGITPSSDISLNVPLYDTPVNAGGPLYDYAATATSTRTFANAPIPVDRSTKPTSEPKAVPRKPREFGVLVAKGTNDAQC